MDSDIINQEAINNEENAKTENIKIALPEEQHASGQVNISENIEFQEFLTNLEDGINQFNNLVKDIEGKDEYSIQIEPPLILRHVSQNDMEDSLPLSKDNIKLTNESSDTDNIPNPISEWKAQHPNGYDSEDGRMFKNFINDEAKLAQQEIQELGASPLPVMQPEFAKVMLDYSNLYVDLVKAAQLGFEGAGMADAMSRVTKDIVDTSTEVKVDNSVVGVSIKDVAGKLPIGAIALYSHHQEGSMYSVGDNIYVMSAISVPGEYKPNGEFVIYELYKDAQGAINIYGEYDDIGVFHPVVADSGHPERHETTLSILHDLCQENITSVQNGDFWFGADASNLIGVNPIYDLIH